MQRGGIFITKFCDRTLISTLILICCLRWIRYFYLTYLRGRYYCCLVHGRYIFTLDCTSGRLTCVIALHHIQCTSGTGILSYYVTSNTIILTGATAKLGATNHHEFYHPYRQLDGNFQKMLCKYLNSGHADLHTSRSSPKSVTIQLIYIAQTNKKLCSIIFLAQLTQIQSCQ